MKGRIIYGGSFNPVHIGHLRLAIEVCWLLADLADHLEFVPVARHPLKNAKKILPLAMRMEMIEISIGDLPEMVCNGIEGERENLSYTIDTLKYYRQHWSNSALFFLLGSEDYELMHSWHKWEEFPELCNFAIVPRGNFTLSDFAAATRRLWPKCEPQQRIPESVVRRCPAAACMTLTKNTCAYYLPVPWLPISSSHIRQLWREGRNPEWLMPPMALDILKRNRKLVNACWTEED